MTLLQKFKLILYEIYKNDTNYDRRNKLTYIAIGLATQLGYPVGIRIDPEEPKWPVVYIELPTGQISWHVPEHKEKFDGHTTEEKYRRLLKFVQS